MQCAYCYNIFDETKSDMCPECGKYKKFQEIQMKFDDTCHLENSEEIFSALRESLYEECQNISKGWNERKLMCKLFPQLDEYFQRAIEQINNSKTFQELYTIADEIQKDAKYCKVILGSKKEKCIDFYEDTVKLLKTLIWLENAQNITKLKIENRFLQAILTDAGDTYFDYYLFYVRNTYENISKKGFYLVRYYNNQWDNEWNVIRYR